MKLRRLMRTRAFTLIELSLVLLIVSLLAAAALRYTTARRDTGNTSSINASLDAVDAALLNYRTTYGRLPCPADITAPEQYTVGQSNTFGVEIDTSGAGSGKCTGANFTATNFAAGSIPTKTLRLADKYAYDSWGRKVQYGVDTRMTATNAFTLYPIYYLPLTTGGNAFTVNSSYGNPLTKSTIYPVYILTAFGKNGHGGFMRNISTACTLSTCPIFNYGSTNTDELANCNCNSSAVVSATFPAPPVFVQDTPNIINGNGAGSNSGTLFDDVVRYKTRAQMATTAELQ